MIQYRAGVFTSMVLAACIFVPDPHDGGPVVQGCPVPRSACPGGCVSTPSDSQNCGGCGVMCSPGESCSDGVCTVGCGGPRMLCGDVCVDPLNDNANCGACGASCGGGMCLGGACRAAARCGLAEGAACVGGGAAPACCADERLCTNHGPGLPATCCRVQGGSCTVDAGCCDSLVCRGGICSPPRNNIEHVVLIVQENHTFDSYFGRYCTAAPCDTRLDPVCPPPSCTSGPGCCERAPEREPGGATPYLLDDDSAGNDASNYNHDRNHSTNCELAQINANSVTRLGRMDHFVRGSGVSVGLPGPACSTRLNWVLALRPTVGSYWDFAANGALADRYFQPIVGSTSSNDMYFAVAQFQFIDNELAPPAIGANCVLPPGFAAPLSAPSDGPTIAHLLLRNGNTFAVYADGYGDARRAVAAGSACPAPPADPDCIPYFGARFHCLYDPSDVPFEYYRPLTDDPTLMKDYESLAVDISSGHLPDFSFVKARTYRNEHPGWSTIRAGTNFVARTVNAVLASPVYRNNTLVLITWDEGGGFFDHVPPPPATGEVYPAGSRLAGYAIPYGTRVPLLAVGRFARRNVISHVQMEHSSILRFLEWNFLGPARVGELRGRDARVNNIGSLLDPTTTGVTVPAGP